MSERAVVALGLTRTGGAPMASVESLVVDERGVLGDRYREGGGTWASHRTSPLTLVATGPVAAAAAELGAPVEPLALRRNVVVEAEGLEDLIGRRFSLGELLLEGERPCDPCRYLEATLGLPGLKGALSGRGGLRALVLRGGTLRLGDRILPVAER